MPSSFRLRLSVLLAAILLLAAGVGFLAHHTWQQAVAVRDHFRLVQKESVRMADAVQSAVQALDGDLLRYKLGGDPVQWSAFQHGLAKLRQWLHGKQVAHASPDEQAIIHTIEQDLAGYADTAQAFAGKDTAESAASTEDEALLATLNQESAALLKLGYQLAEAHNETLDAILQQADQSVARIEWSTFAALGLLLTAGSGTGWLIYRDFISPLQDRLQESRRQLAQQEKLAALGVLSAGIAHEIRNPLTALKARVFTLRKAVHHDASAAEDVSVINGEVDRLERIVRTFLRFARPPEPDLAAVDPVVLLRRVRDLVEPQWSGQQVRIELDESPAPALHGDADLIEQALLNLVQNAAEAMPQGGVIRLRATAAEGRPARVTLEVSDDGAGIPPEVRQRLFDPFFTTKGNGTGLGLALTARIVEKHGGTIRFRTETGRGTTFTITLPTAPAG
jgi:signal transduction histidine kinase